MKSSDIEQALRDALDAASPEVVAAWLFGSVARGQERADSDVDVAILLDTRERPRTLDDLHLDLEADLAQRIGRRVQLVIANHAPYDLVHRILRDGRLLLDRSPSRRIRFEVDARNRFFDMQPIWRRYRSVS